MSENTHRIMRQILELDFGPAAPVGKLQQQAVQVLQNQGLTAMAAVFDQLAGPQQRVRLERLELDLGTLRGADWSEQFQRRLAEQLERQLGQALQTSRAASPTASSTPAADGLFEQFLYFCQQGRLPWWGSQSIANWVEALPNTLTYPQWQTLLDQVQRDRRVRQRLIYTVSDDFLQTMLQRYSQLPETARLQQQFSSAAGSSDTQARWRERFWSIVLAHAPVQTTATGVTLIRQLLVAQQQLWGRDVDIPAPRSRDRRQPAFPPDLPALPAPWQSWLNQAMQTGSPTPAPADGSSSDNRDRTPGALSEAASMSNQPSPAEPQNLSTPGNPPRSPLTAEEAAALEEGAAIAPDAMPLAERSDPVPPWPLSETPQPLAKTSAPEDISSLISQPAEAIAPFTQSAPDVEEDVYVDAAGMVILHPFLQELFNSLDLLCDRQFGNVIAQRRAVALLTYLTFGDRSVPEYELLLPKLLVNWPWAEPLPPDELTVAERAACDELMAAVLRHWSALHSSSADWLREAFFWRDGKLTRVDDGWRLTIERQAQDVLLNRLPWGLGVIRLPWMTDFLYVSWLN
ncbi:MAG: hypothetical protein F6K00_18770 [Leptolyngbya sp. SIOISBB]|nr:hypothetical protein [Leptolyngbya sp. SIOISBB]